MCLLLGGCCPLRNWPRRPHLPHFRHVELWEQRDSTNAAVAECIAFAFSRRLIEPSAPITNSASAFVRPRTLVLGICRAGRVPAPAADK